jgi:hypothetical protein
VSLNAVIIVVYFGHYFTSSPQKVGTSSVSIVGILAATGSMVWNRTTPGEHAYAFASLGGNPIQTMAIPHQAA